jgi:hypothetical protein
MTHRVRLRVRYRAALMAFRQSLRSRLGSEIIEALFNDSCLTFSIVLTLSRY